MSYEWKKSEKNFYLPGAKPELIVMPPFNFFTIEGRGNPNDSSFSEYVKVLYSLSYSIRMSPKNSTAPGGYFEYTVYPLEGVWDITDEAKLNYNGKIDKEKLVFILMIRQPEFVTVNYANETIERTKKKKPHVLLDNVKFCQIEEKSCIQMMHIGGYDDEPASFKKMKDFCLENNFTRESGKHREIYLSDPRKVSADKLKTVLRFKINPL